MGEVTKVTATKRLLLTVSVTIIHNEHGQQSLVLLSFPIESGTDVTNNFSIILFPLKSCNISMVHITQYINVSINTKINVQYSCSGGYLCTFDVW